MAEKYYAEVDRNRRLGNSICFYKGKPVWVMTRLNWNVYPPETQLSEEEVLIADLHRSTNPYDPTPWKRVKYTDDAFSYDAFPLGYMNYDRKSYYMCRIPARDQTQGLSRGNLAAIPSDLSNKAMQTKNMEDCILGVFPSFTEAFESVIKGTNISCAFDRSFSLSNTRNMGVSLSYQGEIIGFWSDKSKAFALAKRRHNRAIQRMLDHRGISNVILDY